MIHCTKNEYDMYADKIAIIRTAIVLVNFIACFFIMANVIHNW